MTENMLDEVERWDTDDANDKCDEEEHHDSFGIDDVKHLASLFLFDCKDIIANLRLLVNKNPAFLAGFRCFCHQFLIWIQGFPCISEGSLDRHLSLAKQSWKARFCRHLLRVCQHRLFRLWRQYSRYRWYARNRPDNSF